MTIDEAIKYLRMATDEAGNEEFSDVYKEMCSMSINALEKQIPKKALAYDDCEKFIIKCTCGKCTDTRFFHGYCTWCGQQLDI